MPPAASISVFDFQPSKLLIKEVKPQGKKSYSIDFVYGDSLESASSLPLIRLPELRTSAFNLQYDSSCDCKLSLSLKSDQDGVESAVYDAFGDPLIDHLYEQFKLFPELKNFKKSSLRLNEKISSVIKTSKPVKIKKDGEDEKEIKYPPILKFSFKKDKANGLYYLAVGKSDNDAPGSKRALTKEYFTTEQLIDLIQKKMPVKTILSINGMYSTATFGTGLSIAVEALSFNESFRQALLSGQQPMSTFSINKGLDASTMPFNPEALTLIPDTPKNSDILGLWKIKYDDKYLRIHCPPLKVLYRLVFEDKNCKSTNTQPKLNLALKAVKPEDEDAVSSFVSFLEALDNRCEELVNALSPDAASTPFYPIVKEKDADTKLLVLRFNRVDDLYSVITISKDGSNCKSSYSLHDLQSTLRHGNVIRPVISIRTLMQTRTSLSYMAYLEAFESCEVSNEIEMEW